MNKSDKIFVAGASGMVGSAIIRNLSKRGHTNIIGSYHSKMLDEHADQPVRMVKVNLESQVEVHGFFDKEKPDHVFLAAAKVGGILANNTYPAQFIYGNLAIQNNVIHAAYQSGVKRLLFLGSSCIYPKLAPQPMKEEHLLTGLLEPTNEPYAIAKIAGIKMCEAYNRQYGTRFMAVMPTNLYGPNDNFDLENSHVLPALVRKFHEAKISGAGEVVVWGSGTPRREFLHVDDMADACVYVMGLDDKIVAREFLDYPTPCFINIGAGTDNTIRELARIIQKVVEFKGEAVFDRSKPDGAPRKLLDVSRLTGLGWQPLVGLPLGIQKTYEYFLENFETGSEIEPSI
jgi:GDP-L-fucose synthase